MTEIALIGVQDLGEDLGALHEARTGAVEIGIAVGEVSPASAITWNQACSSANMYSG